MQLCDKCKLHLRAGDGGDGIVAWRREAHYPEGGPWGGDGGDGGDIILIGDHNFNSLNHLRYLKHITAENGGKGESKMCHGRSAKHVYIKLPLGTSVYDNDKNLIVDIIYHGQEFTICHGGKGGHGNAFFKSSFNKVPSLNERGDLGDKIEVVFLLKYIADVGLVGLPNAGKSSLISSISSAKPKIASYPFTTLAPILGALKFDHRTIVVADIPGLIEGASENKGLGHEFLKHIERCNVLLHVISLDKNDHEDICTAFFMIRKELEKYNKELIKKDYLIICNKCDVEEHEIQLEKLRKELNKIDQNKIIKISALHKVNIEEIKNNLKIFDEKYINNNQHRNEVHVIELKKQKEINKTVKLSKDNLDRWVVDSPYMDYWFHKIPLTTKDNIVRFNQKMQSVKLEEKIKDQGGKKGDTILIHDSEFVVD